MDGMNRMHVSVYQKPKIGNYYCGDSYFHQEFEDCFVCALADGLGSGESAKESSEAVMEIIKRNPIASIDELVKLSNKALVGKRGVVLGLLRLDFTKHSYTFASIGNIGMMTVGQGAVKKRNIPSSGYLGSFARPLKVIQDSLEDDMLFIMFSDGVISKDLSYRFFEKKDVEKITDIFSRYVDHNRPDDTTLMVMKYNE
ncbi:negative regulator of sigma-B (phosphoserine phosphatase) [Natronobacillus azotifigens]|uniref:Indirect negative regulator of sigma-B activity n=1 Tax=Natronobacillus azotifigens TaxID=472978 RepID=A0A9J6RBI2_9BACI|nr:indirect negative regulator of sigma-B activity [Natronobacillus azotifigens]MCZ0702676.1 indirect negative regulator of sigma-B activity [Natronobacillus azotifigens]